MINQPTITADSSRMDIINSILKMVYADPPCRDYAAVQFLEEVLPYMIKKDLLEIHEKFLKSTNKNNKAEE
jgi:hypothetical protein